MYPNYQTDQLVAKGVVAQAWPAKPPAPLDLSAGGITINTVKMPYVRNGELREYVDEHDQMYVKEAGIYCNFADGLLFLPETQLFLLVGYSTDGTSFTGGRLWCPVAALNTLQPVGRFLPDKTHIVAGDHVRLVGSISFFNQPASGAFATGAINPDLAATATGLPVGCAGLRFDVVITVAHSYEMRLIP